MFDNVVEAKIIASDCFTMLSLIIILISSYHRPK